MANVSHELRTPLASILGYTEILRREDMTFEKKKIDQFLDIINDQGDHLLRLVSSMLDVNSLESGAVVLKLTQHNINDLINESIKQLQHKLSDYKGKLRLSLDDKLKKIYIDHDKVIQIFSSILDNAIKFSPDGRDITITTGKKEEKMFISISDKGVGIPKDQIKLVFSPFYQVDSSATRKFAGTGLGLYVAKSYVELHDGEISVSSKEGEGATFEITLATDLKPAQKSDQTAKKPREEGKDESYKIVLVVDDNDDVGEIVKFMLKDACIVHTANNGQEGVSKSQELKPSLIFMDLAMPGISGFEATKRIKSNKETRDIPVVALSARTMPQEIERAIQAGCSEHIPKPFSVKTINDVVARYCS
jgi:CheY-like chemotaxis protein